MEQVINKIKLKLNGYLPGEEAQYLMAPLKRKRVSELDLNEGEVKNSAVLVALCIDENQKLYIPLTERYSYEGAHSGQVSLPGGKFEDNDETLINTALRECHEEIGIRPINIELLGQLSQLYIPVSQFMVQPVVGFCTIENIELSKNEREVKRILKLYIDDLLNEDIVNSGLIDVNDNKIKAPYFEVEGLKVWGATAMILSELKVLLLH